MRHIVYAVYASCWVVIAVAVVWSALRFILRLKGPKRIAWLRAFLILLGGALFYAVSLLVALASDGTTWDRYIPLFRYGQDIGFLVFAGGLLGVAIVALTTCIGWLSKHTKS